MRNKLIITTFIGIISLVIVSGCTPFNDTLKIVKDPDLTQGCKVVDSGLGFNSYFQTTAGKLIRCELKCSSELPANYHFKYSNQNTGCYSEIHTNNAGAVK